MKHLLTALLVLWVMWHKEHSNFELVWKPGDLFESKNQCRAAIFDLIELRVKEAKRKNPSSTFTTFEVAETGVLGYLGDKITDGMESFTCVPEGRKPLAG